MNKKQRINPLLSARLCTSKQFAFRKFNCIIKFSLQGNHQTYSSPCKGLIVVTPRAARINEQQIRARSSLPQLYRLLVPSVDAFTQIGRICQDMKSLTHRPRESDRVLYHYKEREGLPRSETTPRAPAEPPSWSSVNISVL